MRLLEAIDIFAGGPGSGCHGENCGRPKFATTESGTKDIAKHFGFKKEYAQPSMGRVVYKRGDLTLTVHNARGTAGSPWELESVPGGDWSKRQSWVSKRGEGHKGNGDLANLLDKLAESQPTTLPTKVAQEVSPKLQAPKQKEDVEKPADISKLKYKSLGKGLQTTTVTGSKLGAVVGHLYEEWKPYKNNKVAQARQAYKLLDRTDQDDKLHIIADKSGKILGIGTTTKTVDDMKDITGQSMKGVYVDVLASHPAYATGEMPRAGIGTAMMKLIAKEAAGKNAGIYLQGETGAGKYYQKIGMTKSPIPEKAAQAYYFMTPAQTKAFAGKKG